MFVEVRQKVKSFYCMCNLTVGSIWCVVVYLRKVIAVSGKESYVLRWIYELVIIAVARFSMMCCGILRSRGLWFQLLICGKELFSRG